MCWRKIQRPIRLRHDKGIDMQYNLGSSTFSTFVWLKSGALFQNPQSMNIEMTVEGAYSVEVLREDGTTAGKATRPNPHGGWASFDFKNGGEFGGGIPDGKYKVRLVNASPGTRQVRGGDLTYDGEYF